MNHVPDNVRLFASNAQWREMISKATTKQMRNWLYREYLESSAWQKKRRELFEKEPSCQVCRFAEATEAHHSTYERLGDEGDGDLIALCWDCHRAEHHRIPTFAEQATGQSPVFDRHKGERKRATT